MLLLARSRDRRQGVRIGHFAGAWARLGYPHPAWLLTLALLLAAPLQPARAVASSHSPAVYVALGDSLTFGLGADHPASDSYPVLLARHLPPGSHLHNLGIPGITVADAIDQELPAALASHPTLATVWLGLNDITISTAPADFSAGLARVLGALQRADAKIFVANMPNPRIVPITALNPDDHLTRKYNSLIAAIAPRYGATVVDIYTQTNAIWGVPALLTDDDVHPTTRGYTVIARIFFQAMHQHGAL
jgi:lysophospholipase L1-like esterase